MGFFNEFLCDYLVSYDYVSVFLYFHVDGSLSLCIVYLFLHPYIVVFGYDSLS